MNKKTYILPQTVIMTVSIEHNLCFGSLNPENPASGLDDNLENGGDDPGDFTRRRTVWDEEEED